MQEQRTPKSWSVGDKFCDFSTHLRPFRAACHQLPADLSSPDKLVAAGARCNLIALPSTTRHIAPSPTTGPADQRRSQCQTTAMWYDALQRGVLCVENQHEWFSRVVTFLFVSSEVFFFGVLQVVVQDFLYPPSLLPAIKTGLRLVSENGPRSDQQSQDTLRFDEKNRSNRR